MSAKANGSVRRSGWCGRHGRSDGGAYNQGVSLWNAQKFPEAQAQFEKAIKLDPKEAEAYYYLAMCLVNQNKITAGQAEP